MRKLVLRKGKSLASELLSKAQTSKSVEQNPTLDPWLHSPPKANIEEQEDVSKKTVFLFPGQGSEFVGMGSQLYSSKARLLFDHASSILGYDLAQLCLKGPASELRKTIHSQPAVFVTSLAALQELATKEPEALINNVAAGGFSSGEYAALVFAECLSFEKGLELVQKRAELMQKASEATPSGMMSIYLRYDSKLGEALEAAKSASGLSTPVCRIASHLFTQFKVIGGHECTLQFLQDNAERFHLGPMKRLNVSGAFHTEIMYPAAQQFQNVLKSVKLNPPRRSIYSNVTGNRYPHKEHDMKKLLFKQIYQPVRWEQIIHSIYKRSEGEHFPSTFELGPGSQLETILKRTNGKAGRCVKTFPV